MHIDGFEVSFLVRIEDVTSKMLENVTDDMSEDDRSTLISKNERITRRSTIC